MDDFEIEVSDLWEDDPPDWDTHDDGIDGYGTAHTIESIESTGTTPARWRPARSPFTSRLTRRDKLARGGVALVAVFVACALLIMTSAPVRRELTSMVTGSPPAHSATPGTEMIYFEDGVPWGTLSLDGHTVHRSSSQLFGMLQAARGHHTLTYLDPPFAPLRCQFTVPLSPSDTCPLEIAPPVSAAANSLFVRVVNLGAIPDMLPPGSFQQLVHATDSALASLASSTLLLPGSRYLDARGRSAVATQPLLATLHFHINQDPSVVAPYMPGQHLCSQVCFLGEGSHAPDAWGLLAMSRISWTYATPGGSSVVTDAPAGTLAGSSTTPITLAVTWTGTWHVVAEPQTDQFGASPVCDIAQALMPPVETHQVTEPSYSQRQLPALNAADGCLITTQINAPGNTAGPAYVLYRFGVLLAVNDEAHVLFPSLPAAGTYEQGLVRQMVGPGGFG